MGGFTITSPPQASLQGREDPHIELAIQDSPSNPPAAYLWRPASEILNSTVTFRVGGNFFYPPPTLSREECQRIDRLVLIAGGVGINPIISMVSAMNELGVDKLGGMVRTIRLLYTSRRQNDPTTGQAEKVLFEERLNNIARDWKDHERVDYKYTLFVTGETAGKEQTHEEEGNVVIRYRRIFHDDLFEALGPENSRLNTVIYVCGLPRMTDEYVALLQKAPGMEERRVLCEKWW